MNPVLPCLLNDARCIGQSFSNAFSIALEGFFKKLCEQPRAALDWKVFMSSSTLFLIAKSRAIQFF